MKKGTVKITIVTVIAILILSAITIIMIKKQKYESTFANGVITLNGETYNINETLNQFLNNWRIDYTNSDAEEGELLAANKEDDVFLALSNATCPEGVSVVVESHSKKDIPYEKAIVSEIIVDYSQMTRKPTMEITKKVHWNSSRQQIEKEFGKPIRDEEDDEEIMLIYQNDHLDHGVNFYLQKRTGLYKVLIY